MTIYPNDTLFGELEPHANAIEISEIVDPDTNRLFAGFTLFKNSLGGRIAVYPFDMNLVSDKFPRLARQNQMISVLKWLSHDKIPLMVKGGHNTLPLRMDYDDRIIIAVFCLSLDSWENTELTISLNNQKVKQIMELNESGKWQPFDSFEQKNNKMIIKHNKELTYKEPLILEVITR